MTMKKTHTRSDNFKHISHVIAPIILGVITAGCGSKVSDRADDIDNGQKNFLRASDLIDQWKGPCAKSDILNLSASSTLKFDPNAFEREVDLYSNDVCDSPAFRIRYQGEYTVGSGKGYPEDVYAIDFRFDRVTVTATSDAGAELLDKSDFCGQEVWVKDQEVDLTGTSASAGCILDDTPNPAYDVFRVKDQQLQMGKMGIFAAPSNGEKRAKEVSSEIFVRQ